MTSPRRNLREQTRQDSVPKEPIPLDVEIVKKTQTESGSIQYEFDVDAHVKTMIKNMRSLWRSKEMTDVMLLSEDKTAFHYHGVMLASCSQYFQELLSGTEMQFYRGSLAAIGVKSTMLEILQDYLYRPDAFIQYRGDKEKLQAFANRFCMNELSVDGIMNTERFLKNLGLLYSSRILTFTLLNCPETEFPCHAAIIAACVPALRPTLTREHFGSTCYDIYEPINVDFSAESIRCLLDYIYTATVVMDAEVVVDLLKTSIWLRVLSLARACCDFIRNCLDVTNVLSYRACVINVISVQNDDFIAALKSELDQYVIANFALVIQQKNFNLITEKGDLIAFLTKSDLSEVPMVELVDVLIRWCLETDEKKEWLPSLLSLVSILKDPKNMLDVIAVAENLKSTPALRQICRTFRIGSGAGKNPDQTTQTETGENQLVPGQTPQQTPPRTPQQTTPPFQFDGLQQVAGQQHTQEMQQELIRRFNAMTPEAQQQQRAYMSRMQQAALASNSATARAAGQTQ